MDINRNTSISLGFLDPPELKSTIFASPVEYFDAISQIARASVVRTGMAGTPTYQFRFPDYLVEQVEAADKQSSKPAPKTASTAAAVAFASLGFLKTSSDDQPTKKIKYGRRTLLAGTGATIVGLLLPGHRTSAQSGCHSQAHNMCNNVCYCEHGGYGSCYPYTDCNAAGTKHLRADAYRNVYSNRTGSGCTYCGSYADVEYTCCG